MTTEQLVTEFGKMQFLLTGNRFSGGNMFKTRLSFDLQKSTKIIGVSFTVILSVDIDYLEIGDQIKYIHHCTSEINDALYRPNPFAFLKSVVIETQDELIRRYKSSEPAKLFELPEPDKMREEEINSTLSRLISDYNNRIS